MRVIASALSAAIPLFLCVRANAEPPRALAFEEHLLMCWRDGGPVSKHLSGVEFAPPVASLMDVKVVSIVPLFRDERDSTPVEVVQPASIQGKAALEECKLGWRAPMIPVPEGTPRDVVPISNGHAPYLASIRAAVRQRGLVLAHLLRIDLDGDGTPEVIFTGSFRSKPSQDPVRKQSERGPAPKWLTNSVVGVTSAIGDRVLVNAVNEDYLSQPGASIVGVTDVEGDGRFEVVFGLHGDHWTSYVFIGLASSAIASKVITQFTW